MEIFKIFFVLFYILCFIIVSFKEIKLFDFFINKKFIKFLDSTMFFCTWKLFIDLGATSNNIRILVVSKNKTLIWFLRNGEKIGNINIKSDFSRAALCYHWDTLFNNQLNEYFFEDMKDFLSKQSDELIFFKIEKIYYDSITLKEYLPKDGEPNPSTILFEWKKEDEYFSFN